MSVCVIVNPIAGGCTARQSSARVAHARAIVAGLGEDAVVVVTEHRGHARPLSAQACRDGARLVIAWGGDGTVHEVASALLDSEAALGIVRSGSGDGLARALGVARAPDRAIHEACRAEPRRIDVGDCDGEPFFNLAGVGFDAEVAAAFDSLDAGTRGLRTYLRIATRALVGYTARSYTVNGRPTRPALLVTVANGSQFGNGARIAPTASVSDGLLDLVVFEERSRLRTLGSVPRLFTGGIGAVRGVTIRQLPRVVIEDLAPLIYHLDGEPRGGSRRLTMTVRPQALRVCVR